MKAAINISLDNLYWVEAFTWNMGYGNRWRVNETSFDTDKIRFEFAELGGTIGEIGIMGVPNNDTIAPNAVTDLTVAGISNVSAISNIISVTTMRQVAEEADWLNLDSAMLSYEAGNERISLDTLVDEQNIFATDPEDTTNNLTTSSRWNSTWGDIPVFTLDLGALYSIETVAMHDYWGAADLTVQYWNNGEWSNLFSWDMSYGNAWKVINTDISTDKLRFKFSELGGRISEIGIKGLLND